MSHMKNKSIDERNAMANESGVAEPEWCVNCQKEYYTGYNANFCCRECLDEWDNKMERWRTDLLIEDLIFEELDEWRHLQNLKKSSLPLAVKQ